MTCHNCRTQCRKFGRDRKGHQRYRCCQCYKTYSERPDKLDGTYLPEERITEIIRLFVEGCSVRSIERITGTHRDTILNVLVLAGDRCERLLENTIHSLHVRDVECDEIWAYVYAKDKNLPEEMRNKPGVGSVWTWVALDPDTKLVPCWFVSTRDAGAICISDTAL